MRRIILLAVLYSISFFIYSQQKGDLILVGDPKFSGYIDQGIHDIYCGNRFNIMIKEDGTLVGAGHNYSKAMNIPEDLKKVKKVSCNSSKCYALLEDSTILFWGGENEYSVNTLSEIDGVIDFSVYGGDIALVRNNKQVVVIGYSSFAENFQTTTLEEEPVSIKLIYNHLFIITKGGKLISKGTNEIILNNLPPLDSLPKIKDIAASRTFLLALTVDNKVLAWGDNTNGQLNIPDSIPEVLKIAAGHDFGLALTKEGKVFHWGNENTSQSNKLIFKGKSSNVKKIIAGRDIAMTIDSSGIPHFLTEEEPLRLPPTEVFANISKIKVGQACVLGLTPDGDLIKWGYGAVNEIPENIPELIKIYPLGSHLIIGVTKNNDLIGWATGYNGSDRLVEYLKDLSGDSISNIVGDDNNIHVLYNNGILISGSYSKSPYVSDSNVTAVELGSGYLMIQKDNAIDIKILSYYDQNFSPRKNYRPANKPVKAIGADKGRFYCVLNQDSTIYSISGTHASTQVVPSYVKALSFKVGRNHALVRKADNSLEIFSNSQIVYNYQVPEKARFAREYDTNDGVSAYLIGDPTIITSSSNTNYTKYHEPSYLFPNPVKSVLYLDNGDENTKWEIRNQTGGFIKSGFGNVISVKNLNSGMYFLKTEFGVNKFIKE